MNRRKAVIVMAVIMVVLLIGGVFGYGYWQQQRQLRQKDIEEQARERETETITYNGVEYEYNYGLRNVLFIGVDKTNELGEYEEGYAGQADCLILLSMDKDSKTTRLLEMSRDSMTDVEVYAQDGTSLGVERMQIAAQYAYGDGQKRSCQLTMNAVSAMLYEIPIHSYIALSIDGIATVTELMGGVTITVPKDYTHIDPSFEKGATLVLKGEKAERYVRYRDTNVTGSNNERMERQTQFLRALALQLQGKDMSWYQEMQEGAKEYLVTDITLKETERLSEYTMDDNIQIVPGEVQAGEKHDEFIVDGEKLKEIIVKLLYKPKE